MTAPDNAFAEHETRLFRIFVEEIRKRDGSMMVKEAYEAGRVAGMTVEFVRRVLKDMVRRRWFTIMNQEGSGDVVLVYGLQTIGEVPFVRHYVQRLITERVDSGGNIMSGVTVASAGDGNVKFTT